MEDEWANNSPLQNGLMCSEPAHEIRPQFIGPMLRLTQQAIPNQQPPGHDTYIRM